MMVNEKVHGRFYSFTEFFLYAENLLFSALGDDTRYRVLDF